MIILILLACHDEKPGPDTPPGTVVTDSEPSVGDDTGSTPVEPPPDCDTDLTLPLQPTFNNEIPPAEDFAFDSEGAVVLVDERGHLIAVTAAGDVEVVVPGAATFASGMRLLPDGDYVFSDATLGVLYRIDAVSGGRTAVVSGLSYPNGLEISLDGMVFVSEQDAGRVRRIDPDTGASEVIASGLYNPNGLSLNREQTILYIGSFGARMIWQLTLSEIGTTSPAVTASPVLLTPESPGLPPPVCSAEGELCSSLSAGLGVCREAYDVLVCTVETDTGACAGRAEGDTCTTLLIDDVFESTCTAGSDALFCPRSAPEALDACANGETSCAMGREPGYCTPSFEGVPVCVTNSEYTLYTDACAGMELGTACEVLSYYLPFYGECSDASLWGFREPVCLPTDTALSGYGGLDGLNVDACGRVYVTEYIQHNIWRFEPDGAGGFSEPELLADRFGAWIPNLHWGNGVGGWDRETLYVMDMERGLGALGVGVEGHGDAFEP